MKWTREGAAAVLDDHRHFFVAVDADEPSLKSLKAIVCDGDGVDFAGCKTRHDAFLEADERAALLAFVLEDYAGLERELALLKREMP